MKYIGNLYGNIRGTRKYFDTGKTSEDWDALEKRAEGAELKVKKLREALLTLRDQQNNADRPLCRAHWQMAMDEVGLALAQTEDKK